jgi:hypothetical protein
MLAASSSVHDPNPTFSLKRMGWYDGFWAIDQ